MLLMAQVGDVGLTFTITVQSSDGSARDISGASSAKLHLKAPSGVDKEETATISGDGSSGVVTFTTEDATTLDESGTWSYQVQIQGTNLDRRSARGRFVVQPNL